MNKQNVIKKILEWFGVITAIIYSLLVASNTGYEVLGFTLLCISALAIGLWALLCKHKLQHLMERKEGVSQK